MKKAMKTFRKIHLWLAMPFGIVISIICLTGALLVIEKPVTRMLYPDFYGKELPNGTDAGRESRSMVGTLRAASENYKQHGRYSSEKSSSIDKSLTSHRSPLTIPDSPQKAEKPKRKRLPFFRKVMQLHRWLLNPPAKKGEKSPGKIIVGISTVAFVFTLISGIFIWWPRNGKVLMNRLQVKFSKGCPRFLLDAHVSLGFWTFFLLLLMALTGLTWSFSSYREAFYTLLGSDGTDAETRRLIMALHTGTWGGVVTQTLYFVAAFIGGTLPLTGYYLWWKRKRKG